MHKLISTLLLLVSSLSISSQASEIGLWYSAANPDFKPFDTEYGWALTLEHDVTDDWFVKFNHYDSDFQASGPRVGGLRVDYWQEVGAGYNLDHLFENLYVYASYTQISTTGEDLDGPAIHLGYRTEFSKEWSGFIQVGQLDTGFFDIQLEIQMQYQLNDALCIAFGLRDHHKWDMTNYHLGVKWQF